MQYNGILHLRMQVFWNYYLNLFAQDIWLRRFSIRHYSVALQQVQRTDILVAILRQEQSKVQSTEIFLLTIYKF